MLIDVQFTDNQATNLGGGLAAFDTVSLDTCTFLNNSAGVDGGAIHVSDTEVVVTDGIVHNNLSDGPNATGGAGSTAAPHQHANRLGEAARQHAGRHRPRRLRHIGRLRRTSDFVCTDDDSTSACVP